MAKEFEAGDRVSWGRGVTGAILRKATCRLIVSGEDFPASRTAPCFLVRRDADGGLTAVKLQALRRLPH